VRLPGGEDRPVLELRAEARHRLGQVRGRHDEPDAGDRERGAGVDADDPRPGAIEPDELDVEDVLEVDVGHVGLPASDAVEPTDPRRRGADVWAPHRVGRLGGPISTSMICS
jgi:hypothetical protein